MKLSRGGRGASVAAGTSQQTQVGMGGTLSGGAKGDCC